MTSDRDLQTQFLHSGLWSSASSSKSVHVITTFGIFSVSVSLHDFFFQTRKKVKEAYLYSVYYELVIFRRSGMAHATHTFIHKCNEPLYLPLTPVAERRHTLTGTHFLFRWG